MKSLRNERGVALVTALLLTMIALAITMALLYMVTWQTKLSGEHRRYKTAIEASQGGADIFAKQIFASIFSNMTGPQLIARFPGLITGKATDNCLRAKVNSDSSGWGVCGTDPAPFDPTVKADITLTLPGAQTSFNVYAKIVDTQPGNSDLSGFAQLDSGVGVTGMGSGVAPKHIPALYRIEVQGQKRINPQEKSRLSILYAY